ncbi:hypothetical protein LUZ60_008096 [Juncus effusus]|nr:hypothetical protein LUZ60_008096 [Juncus effusus]
MPRILYSSSDSEDEPQFRKTTAVDTATTMKTPFSRKRPIRDVLGGGKVADILLWRHKNLSGGILAGATLMWIIFEVIEYNFIALCCDVSIVAMLLLFVWSSAARLLEREPPKIPEALIPENIFNDVAFEFHERLSHFISLLQEIASGKDLQMFLIVIASLWILSIIGSSCSFLSLSYLGFLMIHTIPALYERYETEINQLFAKGNKDMKKFYKILDSQVMKKIPRGPRKGKKFK